MRAFLVAVIAFSLVSAMLNFAVALDSDAGLAFSNPRAHLFADGAANVFQAIIAIAIWRLKRFWD